MFTHIFAPLDGSELAEAALPVVRHLAERFGARVTLFHVIERNAPRRVHGEPHLTDVQEARAYLERVADAKLRGLPRIECHVHETETERVSASIVEHAGELGHDLVVMCSHGKGKALHLLFGSIAQKVIAEGTLPVLFMHPAGRREPPPFQCRQLLVPFDGDPEHEKALPLVRDLARACASRINLVTVIPTYGSLSPEERASARTLPATTTRMLELERRERSGHLEALARSLENEGIGASAYVLRGDPAETIARAASDAGMDLIAVATHGKTGMDAFWAGNVAHGICSRSSCPILLIPVR